MSRALVLVFGCFILVFTSCIDTEIEKGKLIYKQHCQNCHQANGEGLKSLMPPVAKSDYLEKNRSTLPCLIKYGISDSIVVNGKIYQEHMPAIKQLSEYDIMCVLNYINTNMGNQIEKYEYNEVLQLIRECKNSTSENE